MRQTGILPDSGGLCIVFFVRLAEFVQPKRIDKYLVTFYNSRDSGITDDGVCSASAIGFFILWRVRRLRTGVFM